jgi:hypothetical protein
MSMARGVRLIAGVVIVTAATAVGAQSTRTPPPIGLPIGIRAAPVPLNLLNRSQSTIGSFSYAGGLVLTSGQPDRLHGLSDLEVDGAERLTAIGDEGVMVTARIILDMRGRLVNVRDGRLGSLIGIDGQRLRIKEEADAEGLAQLRNGDRLVSFERHHRIWLYPATGGSPREVPKPDVSFPDANGGLEALTADPDTGPDAYIAGAEGTGDTWTCRVSTRCVKGRTITRPAGTSLVAMRRLTGGRTVYLFRGFANDIARIVLRIERGTTIEAELELTPPLTVDNFEGVAAVPRSNGAIRLYLISDDNASSRQRTLLLAFDWRPPVSR